MPNTKTVTDIFRPVTKIYGRLYFYKSQSSIYKLHFIYWLTHWRVTAGSITMRLVFNP